MDKNLKVGLVLLIGASVFFMCSTVAFFILREAEREKRVYLEQKLKETIEAKETIAKDLEEIKIINKDLESKLDSVKTEAKRLSEELVKEKEAKNLITSQLEEEKKKSESLVTDVMKEKEERLGLVHQLSSAEEAYRVLKEQFELMVRAKETLEEKVKEMMAKKGVELERIEVGSGYRQKEEGAYGAPHTEPAEPQLVRKEASVLVVNKKFNFIVANIGKEDGVNMGTELEVHRDNQLIAKAVIEKLYDNMSAATILPEWKDSKIREGDKVYTSQ